MEFESNEVNELFDNAILLWGEEKQLNQLKEELSELLLAVSHYKRQKCSIKEVIDEVADVLVMCNQIAYMYKCKQAIRLRIDFKLKRLKENIEKEQEELSGSC